MSTCTVADNTLGGCYCLGYNGPWSRVDVALLWMEGTTNISGNLVITIYLGSVLDGVRPLSSVIANKAVVPSDAVAYRAHITTMATNVPVTAGGLLMGTVARYGADAADTYASAFGVMGLIITPH